MESKGAESEESFVSTSKESTEPCCRMTVQLLYLTEDLPAEVQRLISKKLDEVQKLKHPLLLETLENMRKCEGNFFTMDTVFSCVLVYLSMESVKEHFNRELKEKAKMVLEHVLEKEPNNLIALCLNQELNRSRSNESRNTEKIKTLSKSELHLNHAFAVIAFYLYKVNITQAATVLFERAINVWEQDGKGQEIKVVMWKYLLARAYTQHFNNEMFSRDENFDPDKTMARIKELLRSGIDLGKDHFILAARCHADLALAFSKYRLIGIPKDRYVRIDLAPEVCYEKAWNLCDGNEPHVMEKYAMFIRRTAINTESLATAAKIFRKLLDQCPHRHVAAHQLALTYKFLWFEEEKLEQRYLYQNKVKAGKVQKAHRESKNKRRRQRRANKQQTPTAADNDGAVSGQDVITAETVCDRPHEKGMFHEGQMDNSRQEPHKEIHTSPMDTDHQEQKQETGLHAVDPRNEESIAVEEVTDALQHTMGSSTKGNTSSFMQSEEAAERKASRRNKQRKPNDLIHPTWPRDHKSVPHHMNKKPDYYDRLRAENPITDPEKSNAYYLGLAKDYLEIANESAKNSLVLYLVDLARVNISLGDNEAARGYFDNAEYALSASSSHTSHRDIAYLYEQWALMLAKEYDELDIAPTSDLSDSEGNKIQADILDKLEIYFLESIRNAIKIKSKSRVAYYRLTEMLEKPAATGKWMVLYEVYKLVGQDQKASDLLKDKDMTDPQVRPLFKQECLQSKNYDKFLRLALLMYSKLPDHSLKKDIVEVTLLKMKDMPESSSGEETELMKPYGEAVKLCLTAVFMARNDYTGTGVFADIYVLLTKIEGISVKQFFPNAVGDLDIERDIKDQVEELVRQSELVLVSDFKCDKYNYYFHQIAPYADQLQVKPKVFIIQETGGPLPEAWASFGLPCIDVRGFDKTNYHDFLTEVLGKILDTDFSHCTKP